MKLPGKVLMLTRTWDSEYSNAIIAGIRERIGDDDIQLHIFNAYDDLTESNFYQKGREIYFLPDPEQYDGLILAMSTIQSVKYVGDITERFHKYNKPIVAIDTKADNAIFCGLDNYRSMYQLVNHMVNIHDCRTFNYLGGPEDNEEVMERFRAFKECLEAHGIGIEKKRVLHKNFLKTGGREAYKEWKKWGVNMADAVICANDYMALGYVDEAEKDGINVPDYIKVTGFDDIDDARTYSPSITTVDRNWKQLGFDSMDALIEALNGNTEFDTHFVEGYVCYNESCGCDLTRDIRADYINMLRKSKTDMGNMTIHTNLRQILLSSTTMDDFQKALKRCIEKLDIDDVAICLNETFFEGDVDREKTGYDDNISMFSGNGRTDIKKGVPLYPTDWEKEHKILIFSSLRNNVQTYGYSVIPYKSEFLSRIRHRLFVETMSLSLEKINQRIAIDRSR